MAVISKKDTFCLLPPSTLQPQETQTIARTTLPTRWLGPSSRSSGSELEGSWRLSDPRSSFHSRGGSQRIPHHSAILTTPSPYTWALKPCHPQGWPAGLPASTLEAAPATIPSLPPLPPMTGLPGPKDLYLCFRGLRRRSLLLW